MMHKVLTCHSWRFDCQLEFDPAIGSKARLSEGWRCRGLCDRCACKCVHVLGLCRGTFGMPDARLIPVVEEEAGRSAHGDFDGQPPRPRFSKGVSCRTTTYRAAPYFRRLLDRWGWALFGARRERPLAMHVYAVLEVGKAGRCNRGS
jgi:hypothetical protein